MKGNESMQSREVAKNSTKEVKKSGKLEAFDALLSPEDSGTLHEVAEMINSLEVRNHKIGELTPIVFQEIKEIEKKIAALSKKYPGNEKIRYYNVFIKDLARDFHTVVGKPLLDSSFFYIGDKFSESFDEMNIATLHVSEQNKAKIITKSERNRKSL